MGLLLVGLGVVMAVCSAVGFFYWRDAIRIIAAFFGGGAFILILVFANVGGTLYPPDYKYTAVVDGIDYEISFPKYDQKEQVVAINEYASFATHWSDFKRYDIHHEAITIQIPDGKSFEYQLINPPPKEQYIITTK